MSDVLLPPNDSQMMRDAVGIWTNALISGVDDVDSTDNGLSAEQIAEMRDRSGDAYLGALVAGADHDTALLISKALHMAHFRGEVARTANISEITGSLGAAAFLNTLFSSEPKTEAHG